MPTSRRPGAVFAAVLGTRPAALPADAALVAARVVLVWIFAYYGSGKLFGAFHGMGLHGTALYFSNTAHLHPGGFFAVFGGLLEFGGAIALALGIGSRLVGLALFGDMVMAMITVTWSTGIDSKTAPPGYQLNLAVGVLALVIAVFGSGRFSIDSLVARRLGAAERAPASGAIGARTEAPVSDEGPAYAGSPGVGAPGEGGEHAPAV